MRVKTQNSQVKNFYFLLATIYLLFLVGCVHQEVKKEEPEMKKEEISEAKKYYSFGCEYLKNRMYDEAIKNFKKAIEDSSTFVSAYINLGLAYKYKNEPAEMERVYKEMIAIDPVRGHYALGKLYTDEKEYNKAIVEYKEVLKLDSGYVDALYGIGYVEEKLGNIKSAIEYYEKALKLDPENAGVKYCLSKAYIADGKYEMAIRGLKALREAHPEDLDVRRTLTEALLYVKNYGEAKVELQYITSRLPMDISSRIELGKVCEELKDYECAAHAYKEAIAIDTTNITSYWYLIYFYLELGNLKKAEEFLNIAKRIKPESQQVYYLSGTFLVKKGDKLFEQKEYKGAIKSYEEALSEYKRVIKGEDKSLVDSAKKAIESVESKLKRAKEEEWWHRR